MSLIDHFNAFQEASYVMGLSANARSLYFAILGEFNKARYPARLKLGNAILQHLSGINSTHSFDTARNSLINAKLITCKKMTYELLTLNSRELLGNFEETSRKEQGNFRERIGKESFNSISISKNSIEEEEEEEKEKEVVNTRTREAETTTTTATAATAFNGLNSAEVKEMWFKCEGEPIPGGIATGLYTLEKIHGADVVTQAILKASQANTQPRLSFNFVKAVLERMVKGGVPNGRNNDRNNGRNAATPEEWENRKLDWLDD